MNPSSSIGAHPAAVTFSCDADGVGWIVFDAPGARANVFNAATQSALDAAIDAAAASSAKAIVVVSAKERIFIAGADLRWLGALPDVATATEFARRGQKLFQRLTDLPMPVVCAIHGACAGGGFELALACHWRIASDAPATQIGLPETSLGTIPGWGGCVRLPRLIGAKPALDHILQARLVGAAEALEAGLVNEVVASADLRAAAKQRGLQLAAEGVPHVPQRPAVPAEVFHALREATRARTHGPQPAPLAAIDAVEQAAKLPLADAFEIEARRFGEVTAGEVCHNLVHVFFLRDAAKKRNLDAWFQDAAAHRADFPPTRVGVIGAGVMGSGIAQWLAARGFDVVLRDVEVEFLERGMTTIRALFDEAVKRGKMNGGDANAALHRISTTTGWNGFDACDLVVEAIVEDVSAKRRLFTSLAEIVRPDTVLASNTSALPIEEIAGHVPHPERTVGIHFFNPVSRMPLVELVLAPATSAHTAARALEFVKALGKSPIICRSSPGFLVTRVLFFYLNEAVRLWEQGISTDALDGAMRDFGWPMGPLRLIDEVGVDVTEFIFGEMAHYFPERFVRSRACGALLAAGLRGRKNGASRGFYRYDAKRETVNDEETRPLEPQVGRGVPAAPSPYRGGGDEPRLGEGASPYRGANSPRELADHLMRVMHAEAERCLAEGVVKSADDIDFALLSGAGFPAFRGGLMRWGKQAATGVTT